MKRPAVVGVIVLLLAAVGGGIFYKVRKGKEQAVPTAPDAGAAERPPKPEPPVGESKGDERAVVEYDDDPPGTVRLEGIVLDGDEKPVGGAIVGISSNPARTVKTDDGGAFAFDKLLAREYSLRAHHGESAGGPVSVRAHDKAELVVIRLRPAASVEVTVRDSVTKKELAGAEVELRGLVERVEKTGADGKALIKGVAGGWTALAVSADGYAPSTRMIQVSSKPGAKDEHVVLLLRGAAVAGKVVDEAGKPIAGARVTPERASSIWEPGFDKDDAFVTGADGAWKFAALDAGTWAFGASHERYAPGSSTQMVLDGKSPIEGVVITLKAGARLAGRVIDKSGAAVPHAGVRVAMGGGGFGGDVTRHATCDAEGKFDLQGLPRVKVEVMALDDRGASEIVEIDLAAKPETTGLELVLSLDETISGIVVDSAGEPIAEAQVMAMNELGSSGGKGDAELRELSIRGLASDVTNPGGEFTLTGLKPGKYRIRAGRSGGSEDGFWIRPGVVAQAGDKGVKIVLEADGVVVGKVLYQDGSAPEIFSVATSSFGQSTQFSGGKGEFRLEGVPPGQRILVITGPSFARKMTDEIDVKAGDETDAGTITVEKGRSIRGKVVRGDGSPVAAAKVLAGPRLFGDGTGVDPGPMAERMSVRTAESAEDGAFSISGIGFNSAIVVADHAEHGRSAAVRVTAGDADVDLTLVMAQPGGVSGVVTAGGAPVRSSTVMAQPKNAARNQQIVKTGEDGAYKFDRLSADRWIITAMRGGSMMGGEGMTVEVVVEAGKVARADIAFPAGSVKVTISVLVNGRAPDNAMLFLVSGAIDPKNLEELEITIAGRGQGGVHQNIILRGAEPHSYTFEAVVPGEWTACALPIDGNIMDPAVTERLQKDPDSLPVVCERAVIAESPSEQKIVIGD
jgi:protocatechuate 3,4-dioxygenase beta subunit